MVPKSKIKKLKKQLKGVSKQKIADRCEKSLVWVHGVLNCKYYDEQVLKACVDFRDELRGESVQLTEKI
jgi:hypothetical protein